MKPKLFGIKISNKQPRQFAPSEHIEISISTVKSLDRFFTLHTIDTMKYIAVLLTFLCCLPLVEGAVGPTPPPATGNDICELYGPVFKESVKAFADFAVYIEDNESFADLVVFEQDVEAFATRPGHWYFTDVKAFAKFTIFEERTRGFADVSVAYTNFRTSAGCN